MIASNLELNYSFDGKCKVTVTLTGKPPQDIQDLRGCEKPLEVSVKKYRKKRSLDSNSYCWLLIGKIADVLKTNKDDLYIEMLKRYGQREAQLISVVSDAVGILYKATNGHCTEIGESKLNGKTFKHLAILRGSSDFDTREMSILVDGVVSEAKELGIETMTSVELERMMAMYNAKKNNITN